MRVAGYIRVSSDMQVDGYSLAAQRRALEVYCEQEGHRLVDVYADEGVSAHTDVIARRPAFARLLQDAERSLFDVVVVHELSRWARNGGVQRDTLTRLGKANVGFVSLQERMDFTSPVGKMTLAVMAASHELSSDLLGQHVLKAQGERARAGLPVGLAPFGYRNEGGRAVTDPAAAAAVRDAFERRAAGQSYQAIADALNEGGYRTRRGNVFTGFAVKDMVANRFYLGLVPYMGQEYPGQHEAIVTSDLWHRAASRKEPRRISTVRVAHGALAGRVRCVHCEQPLWSDVMPNGRPIYRERHRRPCRTLGRSVSAGRLDQEMGDVFGAIRLSPEALQTALEATRRTLATSEDLDRLQDAKRRLARAYAVPGAFTEAEYEIRMADIDARLRAALWTAAPPLEEAYALVRDLPALWGRADEQERRELLGAAVEEVYVDIERRAVAGFRPVPGLEALLRAAVETAAARNGSGAGVVLVETRGIVSLTPPPVHGGIWAVRRAA